MKEYRVVCDIEKEMDDGIKTTVGISPVNKTGGYIHTIFNTLAEAKTHMKQYIELGKEYMEHNEIQRKHYPNLYWKVRVKNYRIQSRTVTEWK